MMFSQAPQSFSSKPRAANHLTITVPSSTQLTSVDAGLLTPGNEQLLDFILASRRAQAGSTRGLDTLVVVAVIGVGYVGTHLVQAFSEHYPVLAFDVSKDRLNVVRSQFNEANVYLTCDPADIVEATHILVAVPTGVHAGNKTIDKTHLQAAVDMIGKYARRGTTVVIESSVAVGMTRDLLTSLQLANDFRAGMSPERVDPGRKTIRFDAIPKIVSGLDQQSLQAIEALYAPVFDHIVPVSSCEVAEMTKLYENCQRMVCIAYANEMADACRLRGIDPLEVCAAAATKPFGYQPFLPGPGVGGHCIPVNPYYLLSNMDFPLLQAATEKMWQRPAALVDQVVESLCRNGPQLQSHTHQTRSQRSLPEVHARILVVGVGFKPGQSAISHSPAVAMMQHVRDKYPLIDLEFADPLVSSAAFPLVTKMDDKRDWNAATIEERFDAVIVVQAQWGLDLDVLSGLRGVQVRNFTSSTSVSWNAADTRHSIV